MMIDHNGKDEIAVVGMACRVAGADSPSELWDLLASSRDVQRKITRFSGFYHPDGGKRRGMTNVKDAYLLDDDKLYRFDNAFFHTAPLEAAAMDPQQRMLLEIAYEAIESAGVPLEDFTGTDAAVFAGMDGFDYASILTRDIGAVSRYLTTGIPACMAANRLSYFFNLKGASMTIDTACSSAMTALHQAVHTLQRGESTSALVCGAKLILSPEMFVPFSEMGILSSCGRCKSFDASGDGYGRGEGVAALLLKPLKTALADGNPIRAIIKAVRLNQDGRTQGIMMPSSEAQRQNMKSLYSTYNLDPIDIDYLEAHGTGTAIGDPLESEAAHNVLVPAHRERPLVMGSVKSSIGHLEACAALAAIIKTIECLNRAQIPPQMHFQNPNPKIDLRMVQIPTQLIKWPSSESGVRRAAVNTFGAGGLNGHAVLQAYPQQTSQPSRQSRTLLFKVSANDGQALTRLCLKYADYVEAKAPDIFDLAYTLLGRRSTLRHSMFFTASDLEEVAQKLRQEHPKILLQGEDRSKGIIFVFTGQGAQWPQMGKSLVEESPVFRRVLEQCEESLRSLRDLPSWSIMDELLKSSDESNINLASFSQTLCTALQLGLVAMWKSWGLTPTAVMGHSSGEIAAAYAAGHISLRDAIVIAYFRGKCVAEAAGDSSVPKGGMCAVSMDECQVEKILARFKGRVQLAAVNAPNSFTLSGDRDAIEEIICDCTQRNVFCRRLRVDIAYHSHHIYPAAITYEQALATAGVNPLDNANSKCVMFSSVSGQKLTALDLNAHYWAQNMTSTVQFAKAFAETVKNSPNESSYLEIGPHSTLQGPIKDILRSLGKETDGYFQSCMRGSYDVKTIMENAGAMMTYGIRLDSACINARAVASEIEPRFERANVLTDLPPYCWNHTASFWEESRLSHRLRHQQFSRHPLLGSRYLEDVPSRPSWRNLLTLDELDWLSQQYNAGKMTIMPSSIFILMALEACRQLQTATHHEASSLLVSNMIFEDDLPLKLFTTPRTTIELHLSARQAEEPYKFEFDIASFLTDESNAPLRHCSGKLGWTMHVHDTKVIDRVVNHDPVLLESAQTSFLNEQLKNLQVSAAGSTATFETSDDGHHDFWVSPLILDAILGLPSVSAHAHSLPIMKFRLSSIGSIVLPAQVPEFMTGQAATRVHSEQRARCKADVEISTRENVMLLSDLCLEAAPPSLEEPIHRSLFYRMIEVLDLSQTQGMEPSGISTCLDLATYKWPSCDIGVVGLAERETKIILDILQSQARKRFRSVQIVSNTTRPSSGKIRFCDCLDETTKLHLLFVGNLEDTSDVSNILHTHGLLCTSHIPQELEESLSSAFVTIGDVVGLEDRAWRLYRKKETSSGVKEKHSIKIFQHPGQEVFGPKHLSGAQLLALETNPVQEFCCLKGKESYNAIVIDDVTNSAINTFRGKNLVPWLQDMLQSAKKIIWVTRTTAPNPFVGIAGNLLRTLQSEQPSLDVKWIRFDEDSTPDDIRTFVENVLSNDAGRDTELHYEVRGSQPYIRRYFPDDELSALTGVSTTQEVSCVINDKDYEINLEGDGGPTVLVSYPDSYLHKNPESVRVKVGASVVSGDDIASCYGHRDAVWTQSNGTFFAGIVTSICDSPFAHGSRVVGWCNGAHSKFTDVPYTQLLSFHEDVPFDHASACFAAICTGLCIVDGIARARSGDTFRVDGCEDLCEVISKFAELAEARMLRPQEHGSPDFDIRYTTTNGITINGIPVDIGKYVTSAHGKRSIERTWANRPVFAFPVTSYDLSSLRSAFKSKELRIFGNVILHKDPSETQGTIVYKKPNALFSDGAYILVGGLGGIGRFVSSWMVENGAQTLLVISRSGLRSGEAQETFKKINATGATMEVFKADSCDPAAMAAIFSKIRERFSIKGVINMAMILGDAPLASMTGDQWDGAFRLKVDSNWVLHQETLQDSLELFIMFSSIASVLGNRSQAGYNVGNTFLNALAEHRRSIGLPAVSIALGAMTDVGILYEIGRVDLLRYLSRSGLSHLYTHHLAKILEAAVNESRDSASTRPVLLTGLEMFERVDGRLVGTYDQTMLYWTELPEFALLQQHRKTWEAGKGGEGSEVRLRDRLARKRKEDAVEVRKEVTDAFLGFLAGLLGFSVETFDPKNSPAIYGLDSLNGVSCQYWFHRELDVDFLVTDILGARSIDELLTTACSKFTVDHA